MSMSHQVVLTFDVDETKMQENAEKEAGRQVANMLMNKVFGTNYVSAWKYKAFVQQAIKEMMEEEKDQIIQESIKELVKALSRTKGVKERLTEVLDETEGS